MCEGDVVEKSCEIWLLGSKYLLESSRKFAECIFIAPSDIDVGVFFSSYNTVPNDHIVLDLRQTKFSIRTTPKKMGNLQRASETAKQTKKSRAAAGMEPRV